MRVSSHKGWARGLQACLQADESRVPVPDRGARRGARFAAELKARPKAELHLHLRGAIPREYLAGRLRKYPPVQALASAPPSHLDWISRHPAVARILQADDPAEELDGLFRYASFEQFLAAYLFTAYFIREIVDFRDLVAGVREDLRTQNITYAEVTVSIPEYLQQGLALDEILAVLGEDPPPPPKLRWIVDLVRNRGAEAAERMLERLLPARPPNLVGVTLGGAEHLYPPGQFRRVYELAREGGLRTTVHAGEALGAESVWHALEALRVERVGHGVRAIEDPALVRHLVERQIPLEICPTSNIRTGVFPALSAHPVRALYEAGVPLSINTDDPTFFGIALADELAGLERLGFSRDEIRGLADGAFAFAFDTGAAS